MFKFSSLEIQERQLDKEYREVMLQKAKAKALLDKEKERYALNIRK